MPLRPFCSTVLGFSLIRYVRENPAQCPGKRREKSFTVFPFYLISPHDSSATNGDENAVCIVCGATLRVSHYSSSLPALFASTLAISRGCTQMYVSFQSTEHQVDARCSRNKSRLLLHEGRQQPSQQKKLWIGLRTLTWFFIFRLEVRGRRFIW